VATHTSNIPFSTVFPFARIVEDKGVDASSVDTQIERETVVASLVVFYLKTTSEATWRIYY
jgi:hypothetical protein